MKLVTQALLLAALARALAAQAPPPAPPTFPAAIKNVVIIFQENRTPDNLFQGLSPICVPPKTTGCYDISSTYTNSLGQIVPLAPVGLANNFDLSHSHGNFEAELTPGFAATPGCGPNVYGCAASTANQYMYVENTKVKVSPTKTVNILDPYITLAKSYGWANAMYQTNQGPSYPAHQFLFSGTSALTATDDAAATFISENFNSAMGIGAASANGSGCLTIAGATNSQLSPNLTASCPSGCTCNPGDNTVKECTLTNVIDPLTNVGTFCTSHNSMANLLDPKGVTWKYYAPSDGSIWTAPNAIQAICQPMKDTTGKLFCNGPEYTANVNVKNLGTDILTDITGCTLANVSFVIPDGRWSDHANDSAGLGPSWVAAIVNAIGNNPVCPTGTPDAGQKFWDNTAIVITWDDWGGWYDHVKPLVLTPGPPCTTTNCPGDYQYGFRVPLIVVSAYTPPGYINNTPHDFGSILRMIEGIYHLGNLGFADKRSSSDLVNFFPGPVRAFTGIPASMTIKDASYFITTGKSGLAALPPDTD